MSFPFEFTVEGVALSQGVKRKGKWQELVRHSAAQRWYRQSPAGEAVVVMITCFHNNRRFDLDNILKPILDAMNGLIYEDDEQITDLHSHKRDLSAD